MQPAGRLAPPWQRDIDLFLLERRIELFVAQCGFARLEPTLHSLLRFVDCSTGGRTLVRRQRAERFQLHGKRALFAEESHANLIERL